MLNKTDSDKQGAITEIIETSFYNAWEVFSILPDSIWRQNDSTIMFLTGFNDSLLNAVLNFNDSSHEPRSQIEEVLKFFRHLPFSWYVTPSSSPANLGDYLVDAGLFLSEKIIGMAMNLKSLDMNLVINNKLDISLVKTNDELATWIDTFSKGFGVSTEFCKAMTNVYGKLQDESHLLGTIDRKPVATATLSLRNNIASIYDVSTIPEFRNKSIGKTMTLNALKKAQTQNIELCVLQSSEMAVGVYQKIGFVKYYDFQRYTSTLE